MPDVDHTETLHAAERRLQAAQLASDVGALTELLDDAVLFTGPDGNLYSKEDDLGAHRSGHQVLSRVEESELRVFVTGSTGVTWFLGTLEGTVGGESFVARMRYTPTWAREAETGWRIVAAHAMFMNADWGNSTQARPDSATHQFLAGLAAHLGAARRSLRRRLRGREVVRQPAPPRGSVIETSGLGGLLHSEDIWDCVAARTPSTAVASL
jgi:ketosteroid isomerase-like protein